MCTVCGGEHNFLVKSEHGKEKDIDYFFLHMYVIKRRLDMR